jgi:hypothetical protein
MLAILAYLSCSRSSLHLQGPPAVAGISVSVAQRYSPFDSKSVEVSALATKHPTFYVEFLNSSRATINLLAENCSWGYEMVNFEWIDPSSGLSHTISRVPRPWDKNVPIPLPIGPGKYVLRGVDLQDGTWAGLPSTTGRMPAYIKLRTTLEIQDEFLIDAKIWHGSYSSAWIEVPLSTP